MSKRLFIITFAAFLASGALFAFMAFRVTANNQPRTLPHVTTLDAEYQKIPIDGQRDWMDTFTLTEPTPDFLFRLAMPATSSALAKRSSAAHKPRVSAAAGPKGRTGIVAFAAFTIGTRW